MVCTVRSWYRRNLWSVVGWALGSKLLAHLRLFRLGGPAKAQAGHAPGQTQDEQASIEAPVRADPSH